jgi:serine phosphatase RsbU (regulator of sigma subunit)
VTDIGYFSGWYEPAQQTGSVGGDWYKALRLDEDRVFFAVGDVLGHGLEAAIMMGRARQAVLVGAANLESPAVALQRANNALALQEIVATCVVGILDVRERKISVALAGHVCPIFVDPQGRPRFIGRAGLPLGIERETSFLEYSLDAQRGSTLILYTDGLLEFDHDVLAGERRLIETAGQIREFAGPNLAHGFAARVLRGARHPDDIAVLAIAF